jgi:hypothetical protein
MTMKSTINDVTSTYGLPPREEALTPYPTSQIVNPSRQFTRNKED